MKTEERKFTKTFMVVFVVALIVIGSLVAMLWK